MTIMFYMGEFIEGGYMFIGGKAIENKKVAELIVGCYQGDWFPVKDCLLELGADVPEHMQEVPMHWFEQACNLLYKDKLDYWNSLTIKNFLNKVAQITEKQYIWLKGNPCPRLSDELKMRAVRYSITRRDSAFEHCYGAFSRRKQDQLRYLYDLEMILRFFKLRHLYKDVKRRISVAKWL